MLPTELSSTELAKIKDGLKHKYADIVIQVLCIYPIIIFVHPFIPRKRGRGPLINELPYWDAVYEVIYIDLFTVFLVVLISIYKYFKSVDNIWSNIALQTGEFVVKKKQSKWYSLNEYEIVGELNDAFVKYRVDKAMFTSISVGKTYRVVVDMKSKTLLRAE
ncbi:hypothetical protein [Neolewinella xylanilytica]|uniref:hypothetical protein n=1 Tax=Neolewinella xylanilytica TaxID=1514080 RepID=UPI0011AFFB45|nr:hypothetical protein [Neolewinella xylanilytica]